jgi:hypothetical protein
MISNSAILRSLQELHQKVDVLLSQSDDIEQAATDLEATVAVISTGVQSALAIITALEAQVAAGQPVTAQSLADLKQAVTDVGTAGQSVTALAPPAA